jgi:hypothetical protein
MRYVALIGCILLARTAASQGQPTRNSMHPMIGFHYGAPLKWSGVLAVALPTRARDREGFVAFEPGIGGWRASLGYLRITGDLGSGYATRVSVLHTGNRPWRAPAQATFLGLESQYMPLFALGLRLGAFTRVKGEGRRRGLFTADLSLML